MPRAATKEESHPPIVEATTAIAAAVRTYEAALDAENEAYQAWSDRVAQPEMPGEPTKYALYAIAKSRSDLARAELEQVVPIEPRRWYRVGDGVWGWAKRDRGALRLVRLPDR